VRTAHQHADAPHPLALLRARRKRPRRRAAVPPSNVMNSRRLIAFPEIGTTPNAAFNLGHQNRNLRPANWGWNGQFALQKS
jgi:hypothetical protein